MRLCRLPGKPWAILTHARGSLVLAVACAAALTARAATGELTDEAVARLEMDLALLEPGEVARELAPHLEEADERMAPLIAGLLVRGEKLPAETQDALYEALFPLADERIFEPAVAMAQSLDPRLARYGLRLLGRCGHPGALDVLTTHYGKTAPPDQRAAVLIAVGDLGDPAAASLLRDVLKQGNPDLQAEAVIAASRLGMAVDAADLERATSYLTTTVHELSRNLSYTRRAHPERYKADVRRLKVLDDRLNRLAPFRRPAPSATAAGASPDPAGASPDPAGAATLRPARRAEDRESGVPYLLWDGHRFSRTPALIKRDVRYYRDLGFTHSQVRSGIGSGGISDERKRLYEELAHHDMGIGLYLSWDFPGLNAAWKEMTRKGMTLTARRPDDISGFNPVHPDVIRAWFEPALAAMDKHAELPQADRIRFVLIGSEITWGLPPRGALPLAAVEVIMRAARADGILGPGETEWQKLGHWWGSAHGRGRDWRLRQAFEAGLVERLPNAECWVDPIWAVKIVSGSGGTWAYVGDDPMNIALSVLRLKAACWPSSVLHSTQLTRRSGGGLLPHDHLMEANLLALAMGADRLYHWGLNTCEPGREEDPAYGNKDIEPTPEGFPWFRADHLPKDGWLTLAQRLHDESRAGAGRRIWAALAPGDQRHIQQETALAGAGELGEMGNLMGGAGELREPLLAALNGLLRNPDLYDPDAFRDVPLPRRFEALLARRERDGNLQADDLAEMNRLLLETVLAARPPQPGGLPTPAAIPPTPSPNLRELREAVRRRRQEIDPAVRSTGRLLRDRGALFGAWKPLEPRVALVSGIYGKSGPLLALIRGHIPFDVLRDPEHRRTRLPSCRVAIVAQAAVSPTDHAALLELERTGGRVVTGPEYEPPDGLPALADPVVWRPPSEPKGHADSGPGRDDALLARTASIKTALRQAGFVPYFDTERPDLVLQGFDFKGQPMLFVVNDKRGPSDPDRPERLDKGLPNETTFLVRETGTVSRVVDIDTGKELELEHRDDGWAFRDTVPPAWYRIYAVVLEGRDVLGPPPLDGAPALHEVSATRDVQSGAVTLSWAADVPDWVGCDIQWYRICRGERGAAPAPLAEIDGRETTGPGGLVTTYTDTSAQPGVAYAYSVQAVTPLRRPGPISSIVQVSP